MAPLRGVGGGRPGGRTAPKHGWKIAFSALKDEKKHFFVVAGQRFAMMEEKLILSQILRRFKVISLDKREDIIQLTEMILRPKNPLKMKFEPR